MDVCVCLSDYLDVDSYDTGAHVRDIDCVGDHCCSCNVGSCYVCYYDGEGVSYDCVAGYCISGTDVVDSCGGGTWGCGCVCDECIARVVEIDNINDVR